MHSVLRFFSLILPLAALIACAGVPEQPHPPAKPLKIVMVAVPPSAEVSDLEQISSVKPPNDNPKDKALEQTFVDARLSEVFQQSAAAMTDELQAGGRFTVCSSQQLQQLAKQLDVGNKSETLTAEMRQQLEAQHCGDALLRFRITDYGTIPKTWDRWIAVGTGVWIGGITVLAYSKPASRPYIDAYLLSEVIQEGAETYAGYSLFGSVYTPVRIEAELIDLHTGEILWQDTDTGLAHQGSIFPFSPPADEDKIASRLDLSLKRSIQSLVGDLESAELPMVQQSVTP